MKDDFRFELDFLIEQLHEGVSSLEKSVGGRCRERNRKIEKFPYAKFTTRTLWRIPVSKVQRSISRELHIGFLPNKYVTGFLYNSINFQIFSNFSRMQGIISPI